MGNMFPRVRICKVQNPWERLGRAGARREARVLAQGAIARGIESQGFSMACWASSLVYIKKN